MPTNSTMRNQARLWRCRRCMCCEPPSAVSMDPNRYEVSEPELLRGLRLSCMGRFPPGPPRILGLLRGFRPSSAAPVGSSQGQQGGKGLDLKSYEFLTSRPSVSSTTEVPRDRLVQDPDAPLRQQQRLLHDRRDRTNRPVYMTGGFLAQRRPFLASRSSPLLSPLGRRERILQGQFTEQNDY
jgi:hypothetical protein